MIQKRTMRIFDPTPDEYEAIVEVYNRANPHEASSASVWQHWDQHRDPAQSFTRYVVERGGRIGGYGYSLRTDTVANKFRFAIFCLPEWETPELIDQFYSFIVEQCLAFTPSSLICQTQEDEAEKKAWLRNQGFEQIMRYPRSFLSLDNCDPLAYIKLREKVADQGIEIISLVDLTDRDPEWQRNVYDLEMLLNEDVPRPASFSPPPFEKWVRTEFDGPEFAPDLWLIALDGQRYVGMTSLWKSGDGIKILETGLTGVHRDYRRQGIAMALKGYAIEAAQQLGAREIQTSNEENNPMYHLNLQLGFRSRPADIDWQKVLIDGHEEQEASG